MFTKDFWSQALQRSVRTVAQTVISMIGVSTFSVWTVNWHEIVGVGLGAGLISLLMSLDRSTNTTVEVVEKTVEVPAPATVVACGDSLR